MFDLGWSELLLIGVVALIVVGPKDLPGMFREIGRFTGKAKAMAREFSRAMEDAADESGMRDIQKTIKAAADPKGFGTDALKKNLNSDKDPETLSRERAETRRKIEEATATAARNRQARDAMAPTDEELADLEPDFEPDPKPAAAPASKPAPEPEPISAPAEPLGETARKDDTTS